MPTGRKARLVLNCADLNLAKFSLYIVLKFHCTLESVRLNIFENLPCEVPEKIRYSSTDRTVCLRPGVFNRQNRLAGAVNPHKFSI